MENAVIKMKQVRFLPKRPLLIGLLFTLTLMTLTVFGSYFLPHDPFLIDMGNRLQPASSSHWLGTDQLGRDVLSRLLLGAKLTVGLGVLAIIFSILIGVPIGLFSGYIGGKLDAVFMRIIDAILAFPDFILAIAIAGILGPSLTNIIIAIILVRWIVYARVVRGLVLAEKEKEYVKVSKIVHSSHTKTIRLHLLPQIMPEVIAMAAVDIGKIILMISALSYIGLGAQPPIPEWGAMLNDGRAYFQVVPALMIYPGVAIMLTVLTFNLLGDGLKSNFDTRKGSDGK
ncbi:putative D,D-dipeptide transport system permease protein DdpC [Bacillus sp. THAF10]|uniref:nickel transporter permease n=1 Tax=Bacillus sp. THAF10 TaxID=2587848 RepID=UPI0012694D84|nr:nickel transporter permease [Bacillus sp. THAF10]QFT89576.1 putative D,D-dipeptide transport system permease protein DdpC [Bacillus sp. THAF10]